MKKEQISMMDEMNRQLHIKTGAAYWMDWKRAENEKAQPIRVVVESIYPHVVIVKDKYGRRSGIPSESAALDLRKTAGTAKATGAGETAIGQGENHQRAPGREKRSTDSQRSRLERCVGEPDHTGVETEARGVMR